MFSLFLLMKFKECAFKSTIKRIFDICFLLHVWIWRCLIKELIIQKCNISFQNVWKLLFWFVLLKQKYQCVSNINYYVFYLISFWYDNGIVLSLSEIKWEIFLIFLMIKLKECFNICSENREYDICIHSRIWI